MAVPDGEVTERIGVAAWGRNPDPGFQVAGGHPAQHRVDEAGRALASEVAGEVHRGRDGRVRGHPGGQELVGAEAQYLAQRRVHAVESPVGAQAEDRVVAAPAAQRPVGELGGQRGVAPLQPALGEHRRQQQVGVGVPLLNRYEHVVGEAPDRVGPASAAPAAGATAGAATPRGATARSRAASSRAALGGGR